MSKPIPPPLKLDIKTGNLALLASRRNSLSPKLLKRREEEEEEERRRRRRRTGRRTSNFLELPAPNFGKNKRRVGSLPSRSKSSSSSDECEECGEEEDLFYRLRTFSIKDKRVLNTGDELLPRERKGDYCSPISSRTSPMSSSCCNSNNSLSTCSDSDIFLHDNRGFRVVLLGAGGVGKSALVTQFMTSEYINTYDASLDDDFGERTVSVLLDNQESDLIFIDHPSCEMSPENSLATYTNSAAVIVVYSITDRHSYAIAEDILRYLWTVDNNSKSVILVGNKCDLERAREVCSEEGRCLATAYSAKFIETSPGLQHNVDELLVGVLKQCRLRSRFLDSRKRRKKNHFSFNELARELVMKLRNVQERELRWRRSRSCQDLLVL